MLEGTFKVVPQKLEKGKRVLRVFPRKNSPQEVATKRELSRGNEATKESGIQVLSGSARAQGRKMDDGASS